MFILDSLMISGLRWTLQTVATSVDAEMNDDGALREQLLEAEMRREAGEISEAQFRETEASLLRRIRDIRDRRDGGSGPIAFQSPSVEDDQPARVTVEAALTGDYHPPSPPAARLASARTAPPSPAASRPASARQPARPAAAGQVPPVAAARLASRSRAAARSKAAVKTAQRKRRP